MVVFMDQLTQQTPPVAEKLPVIGQVNIACREACQASRSKLESFLVFCGIFTDCFLFNDDYNILLAASLCSRSKTSSGISSKNVQNAAQISLPSFTAGGT